MNENKNISETIIADREQTPYDRLIIEKQELDKRIVKLNAFLSDGEKRRENSQVELMEQQIEIMISYSRVLNERILRWKK